MLFRFSPDPDALIVHGLGLARRRVAWDDAIRLGPAAREDGADLLAIERAAFPWLPEPSGRTLAAFDCSRPFVTPAGPLLRVSARVDGPLAGYVFVQPRVDELFVWDMAHRTAARGPGAMGFGSILMLACVGIAEAAGLPRLRFDVTRRDGRQDASVRLCRRHGLHSAEDSGVLLSGESAPAHTLWLIGDADAVGAALVRMAGGTDG